MGVLNEGSIDEGRQDLARNTTVADIDAMERIRTIGETKLCNVNIRYKRNCPDIRSEDLIFLRHWDTWTRRTNLYQIYLKSVIACHL
ncbi:unnamed protein product [Gongylonema pulchrum]|uniref:Uncharacterized protein n=1 Tax=Gongylonema pulchrum TaxID=637853 RepID=A0A183D0B1_9BILA|nr:unnamed protein product [Gongylonema pulchrum]